MTMRLGTLTYLVLAASLGLGAADWDQWLGPNRNGISEETGLLEKWPEGGPPLAWTARGLGEGFASFSVVGERLYTQGQRAGQQYVMAFDTATGRKLWETPNGKPYENRRGSGPRGTPTYDDGRLYALASNGNLICVEAKSGAEVWDLDLFERFDGSNINWGVSESPLIDGKRVIVHASGSKAGLVALDKSNGKVVWQSKPGEAGYASAVIATFDGVRQYITLTGSAAVGVRADDGKVLWRYERVANRTANIATPVVRDNYVFVSTAYGTGAALLKVDGNRAEEVYFTPAMQNHYTTSILLGDYLYGYANSILTCMEFMTGKEVWKDRAVGKGQIIHAGGMLYLLGEDRVVGLAKPSPEGYKEISRFELPDGEYPTWALPAIANGKLYLRDQDTLYCYDISAR